MGNSKSKQNKLGLVLPDLSNQPGQPRVSLAHDRMSPFHAENTEAVSDEVVLLLDFLWLKGFWRVISVGMD